LNSRKDKKKEEGTMQVAKEYSRTTKGIQQNNKRTTTRRQKSITEHKITSTTMIYSNAKRVRLYLIKCGNFTDMKF